MTALKHMMAELAEQERWALFREYATAVRRIEGQHLDRLMSLEAPWGFWDNCGAPGVASISPLPDGSFDFADKGDSAVILPVYDSETPAWAPLEQRLDGLFDILAFNPAQPDCWWLRRGQTMLLGSIYIALALREGCALPLYSNPMRWLQADGEGVVILDWGMAPALLCDVDQFLVEDVEIGDQLEAALRPDIWIMETAA